MCVYVCMRACMHACTCCCCYAACITLRTAHACITLRTAYACITLRTHTHTHKHTHTNTHTHIQHKFTHVYAGPQRRLVHSRPLKNNIILFKYKYIRRVRDLKKNNDISIKYKIHTQGHNEGGCMRDLVCSNFTS